MSNLIEDHYKTLGLPASATAEEIRTAYLTLVRLNPPDTQPDKFREIHNAYQLLSNPLIQANAMLKPCEAPDIHAIISEAENAFGRLPKLALLALGDVDQ